MSTTLVRLATSFTVPLVLDKAPPEPWLGGPFENQWRTGARSLDGTRVGRRKYLNDGLDPILYEDRWHRSLAGPCLALSELELKGAEVLRIPSVLPHPTGLLVVHANVTPKGGANALGALSRAVNHNDSHGEAMRSWLEELVRPWARVHTQHRRSQHVTLATSSARLMPGTGAEPGSQDEGHDSWLARLAASGRHAPDPDRLDSAGVFVGMSAKLRGCVSRSGIAVVGLEPDSGASDGANGFDYGGAEFFVEGLYTDVLLLGQLQAYGIHSLREQLNSARERGSAKADLEALELKVIDFRRKYWRSDFAPQGSQDDFLAGYQEVHGHKRSLDELASQITEYSSHVQRREQELTNALLGFFALLALPISAAIAIWAGIDHRTARQLVIALTCAAVLVGLILCLPGARQLLRQLLRRNPSDPS